MSSPPLPLPLSLPLRDPDAFQVLAREEHHLQQSLQAAIDAQSEGLLAGFATAAPAASSSPDAISSAGRQKRTGTAASESVPSRKGGGGIVIPVRQPAPQKLGLQGARKGIARAMAQLEGLKSHEEELLEVALAAHEEDIAVVEALGRKREGLEASIQAIETEESSRQVQGLCEEERSLDEEIRTLEAKLAEMKTRHRQLRTEIEGLDNRVQSQLSSYQAALALAEKETRNFLARPSARAQTSTTTKALASRTKGNQSLWDLPVGRRTLPIAQEQFRDEQRMLLKSIAEVNEERTALAEGRRVWADVVQEVTSVEQLLRDEMQRLGQPSSPVQPLGSPSETSTTSPAGAGARAGARVKGEAEGREGDATRSMHTILQHIDTARKRVEQHWHTSVAHKWGLLICCIGAELEALVQGSAVLRATLGEDTILDQGVVGGVVVEGEGEGEGDDPDRDKDRDNPNGPDGTGLLRERENNLDHELELDLQRQRRDPRRRERGAEEENDVGDVGGDDDEDEDNDDGPGADLLGF